MSKVISSVLNPDSPKPPDRGTFRAILTEKNSDNRLTEEPSTLIGKIADDSLAPVTVDPSQQFQTILGFGCAFTEAAAVTW